MERPKVQVGTHPIELGHYLIPTKEVLRLMDAMIRIVSNMWYYWKDDLKTTIFNIREVSQLKTLTVATVVRRQDNPALEP